MKNPLIILMILSLFSVQAVAASVTLTNSDGYGSSSFNSAGNWDNGAAPSGGNDYFTGNYRLRTPAANGSFTFAGNSLTVNNDVGVTDGDLYGFSYKGGDCDITIDNLILDGGSINHINGGGDIFNLYGNLSIVSESVIRAKQGPINIYSAISGSSQITVLDSDTADCKLWFLSSNNTFTGDIVNNGRFGLADDANLNFVIGASGVNNSVSDGGSQRHATFDGDFIFDLTGAGTTLGDNWSVITTTAASTYYGSTFSVLGFTDMGDDTWMGLANGIAYLFDETTGVLFVVSEPASITSDLSNTAVNEAETAVFTTVFTSASTPVVTWYKVADPSDTALDPAQLRIDVQTLYDAQSGDYTSTLSISNSTMEDAGYYYCEIQNASVYSQSSESAALEVYGLLAHWTLDQTSYISGSYQEEIGGYHAAVNGTPTFVSGADGITNSAVQIDAADGWALSRLLNPVNQSGRMTVSFWVNWSSSQGMKQDLLAESTSSDQLVLTDGLVDDDQWQHICMVIDSTTARLYVDGVLQDQGPWSPLFHTDTAINIGIDSSLQNPFTGSMDDMRLYNYALTGFEIADLRYAMNAERSCILPFDSTYDLTGPASSPDCKIDIYDLAAFSYQWLNSYHLAEFTDFSSSWSASGLYP